VDVINLPTNAARDLIGGEAETVEGVTGVLLGIGSVDLLRRLGRGVAKDILDLGELRTVI
jgi:hypothetical protein